MAENRRDRARSTPRLRFTDEWVGVLVLVAVGIFGAAAFEAGVLQRWLHPGARLVILLPQNGTAGLSIGADIDVLGIHAGTVRRVELNPNGEMYAVATIDAQAKPFIRRDSHAVIRRQFVVAGSTYVDVSRGRGEPLDWGYAVMQATTEPNPVDTITATIGEIRARVLPTLDKAQASVNGLQTIVAGLQAGHGTIGKLLVDDTVERRAAAALAALDDAIAKLRPIEARAGTVLARADKAAANLQGASGNLRTASTKLPAIADNAAATTADLPALVTEAQITAEQLRKLIVQLRGSWLLGGHGASKPSGPLPPSSVAP